VEGLGIGCNESPRGANVHYVQLRAGRIDRYRIRTASFANWPLLMTAVPGNLIGDFPLINKSFELCYACCDR
jgi:Ni,Fe-hydrogenase III large subunit